MNLLASHGNGAESILIYETDTLFEERGCFRVLQFADEAVQGAIDLQHPTRIVFEYPRALIHLMEHNGQHGEQYNDIFIIGHGIGTISSSLPDKNCVSVEINEAVVQLSRQYFGWQGTNIHIGDGRMLLEQQQQEFDYIVLDAFTSSGVPSHLCTEQFFTLVMSKLRQHGAVLINITGRGKQDVISGSIYRTLQEVFAYTYAFTLSAATERDIRNSILVGSNTTIHYRLRSMAGFVPYEPQVGYIMYD
jgi:spermidine synthase